MKNFLLLFVLFFLCDCERFDVFHRYMNEVESYWPSERIDVAPHELFCAFLNFFTISSRETGPDFILWFDDTREVYIKLYRIDVHVSQFHFRSYHAYVGYFMIHNGRKQPVLHGAFDLDLGDLKLGSSSLVNCIFSFYHTKEDRSFLAPFEQ